MLYGAEHKRERWKALRELDLFRDRNPELLTVQFLVVCWGRMRYEYTETIREGVRTMIRVLPGGANRDAFASLALSPFNKTRQRLWRWKGVFPPTSAIGMRRGRILPELAEQLESDRINGSASLRTGPQIGEPPTILVGRGQEENQVNRTQTGGIQKPIPGTNPREYDISQRIPTWEETQIC